MYTQSITAVGRHMRARTSTLAFERKDFYVLLSTTRLR